MGDTVLLTEEIVKAELITKSACVGDDYYIITLKGGKQKEISLIGLSEEEKSRLDNLRDNN